MIVQAQQPRLHWDAEQGWLLEVDVAASPAQIERAANWALKIQEDRWRSLPPGERKDECARTVKALKEKKIRQVIRPDRGGTAKAFQSTERMNKGKTFFHG